MAGCAISSPVRPRLHIVQTEPALRIGRDRPGGLPLGERNEAVLPLRLCIAGKRVRQSHQFDRGYGDAIPRELIDHGTLHGLRRSAAAAQSIRTQIALCMIKGRNSDGPRY